MTPKKSLPSTITTNSHSVGSVFLYKGLSCASVGFRWLDFHNSLQSKIDRVETIDNQYVIVSCRNQELVTTQTVRSVETRAE
jgi:hypothetical protein